MSPAGPSSNEANSCGIIEFSSIVVHGRHMQPSGAFVDTFRNFLSPVRAFGQKRDTEASRSPDSWQQLHERSICHILLPLTWRI